MRVAQRAAIVPFPVRNCRHSPHWTSSPSTAMPGDREVCDSGVLKLLMENHTFKPIGKAADLSCAVSGFDALQQAENSLVGIVNHGGGACTSFTWPAPFLAFAQRASTALLALALRCSGVSLAALAGPPFLPPFRPRATAAGFFFMAIFALYVSGHEFSRFYRSAASTVRVGSAPDQVMSAVGP